MNSSPKSGPRFDFALRDRQVGDQVLDSVAPKFPSESALGIFGGVWLYLYRVHTSRVMRPTHETLLRELAGKR